MKILTSIIVSGIFYYICHWVTKDDSTRELIFASLIAITILILCILGERNGRTGYYIPETDEARKDGIKTMRSQAIKEFKRVSRILKGDLKAHEKYLEVSK